MSEPFLRGLEIVMILPSKTPCCIADRIESVHLVHIHRSWAQSLLPEANLRRAPKLCGPVRYPVVNYRIQICAGIRVSELCEPYAVVETRYLKLDVSWTKAESHQERVDSDILIAKTNCLDLALLSSQ